MYQDQARRHGQDVSTTTDEGTFAGGLRHITSVLPSLMNDILQHAPDSQKVWLKSSGKNIEEYDTYLPYNSLLVFTLLESPLLHSWNGVLNIKL